MFQLGGAAFLVEAVPDRGMGRGEARQTTRAPDIGCTVDGNPRHQNLTVSWRMISIWI